MAKLTELHQLQKRIAKAQLAHRTEQILAVAQPTIELKAKAYSQSAQHSASAGLGPIKLGRSRFGGAPDLPRHFAWPCNDGMALTFLCQINLADLPKNHVTNLPNSGILYFFCQVDGFPNRDQVKRNHVVLVHYYNGPISDLVRHAVDSEQAKYLTPFRMVFERTLTLPCATDNLVPGFCDVIEQDATVDGNLDTFEDADTIVLQPDDTQLYWELADALCVKHQLMGHPDLLHDDARYDCGNSLHEQPQALEDWQLLLQLGTENFGLPWDRIGRCYFYLRKQDLAARRFERSWMVLQWDHWLPYQQNHAPAQR